MDPWTYHYRQLRRNQEARRHDHRVPGTQG